MPPPRVVKKRKSTASGTSANRDHPHNATTVPNKDASAVMTPTKGASSRKAQITLGQKQALIDNLQLEITERARKMRAQYALQAQGLKTRLEIRVHRIPSALRKVTVGELLDKYSAQINVKQSSLAGSPSRQAGPVKKAQISKSEASPRPKRKSDELYGDKENITDAQAEQKKRPRTANAQPAGADNVPPNGVPRRLPQSQILSPKSNNSRTLPKSPLKTATSPMKTNIGRPVSPLKPSASAPTATSLAKASEKPVKAKATGSRAASKQEKTTKRNTSKQVRQKPATTAEIPHVADDDGGEGTRRASIVSDAASSSAGTTIVRNTKKAPTASSSISAAPKGKVAGVRAKFEGIAGTGKKVAATKIAAPAATGTTVKGGRTLRKRA